MSKPAQPKIKVLAYALPHAKGTETVAGPNNLELFQTPMGTDTRFQDYPLVILFAGAFEKLKGDDWGRSGERPVCINQADLDLRVREVWTTLERNGTVVFLVPPMKDDAVADTDLFRRVLDTIRVHWSPVDPHSKMTNRIPEFSEFLATFGTAYVRFQYFSADSKDIDSFAFLGGYSFGFTYGSNLFFLPVVIPSSVTQAQRMVFMVAQAILEYRKRTSTELPTWLDEFQFHKESSLRVRAKALTAELKILEGAIADYKSLKGALCYRSEALVEVIVQLFLAKFEIKLHVEEKRVEDAQIVNDQGAIEAVIEIKGVNGSFARNQVNQVDSHRERLGVSPTVPGILIVNTHMDAETVAQKDQAPHPEIIQKAADDNVLLIRTLDLLRFVDLIERGEQTAGAFKKMILGNAGWLKVTESCATVIR